MNKVEEWDLNKIIDDLKFEIIHDLQKKPIGSNLSTYIWFLLEDKRPTFRQVLI